MGIPESLRTKLRNASAIAVLTGAGVSAESGIPTFRDALSGLWGRFDAEQLATPEAFTRNPELVSRWYDERRCKAAACQPNLGHKALAELQEIVEARGGQFTLITQNVDRLHQLAGSQQVIELHGSLRVWRCTDCSRETEHGGPAFSSYPPACACGGMQRPGVVWFGESLPPEALRSAEKAASDCDLFFSLGTSSIVYPAAGLIESALRNSADVLEINSQPTPFSAQCRWSLRGKCGETLPALVQAIRN